MAWRFEIVGNTPEPRVGSAWPYGHYNTTRHSAISKWAEKWGRRAITFTLYTILFILSVLLAIVLVPIALVVDSIRGERTRRQQPLARVILFFVAYLAAEMVAIWVFGLGAYLAGLLLGCLGPESKRWREWCHTHQHLWGHYLLTDAPMWILGCGHHLEGGHARIPTDRTYIAFIRHNSFADTLLPQYLFSDKFRMRYVVKKSLLWDPGLDIFGSRTPSLFIDRQAGISMGEEMKALTSLLDDAQPVEENGSLVHPNIMLCIWPEGTRFSKAKRDYLLNKLRDNVEQLQNDQETSEEKLKTARDLLKRAESLKWMLPPRFGGVLALFEKNETKEADILLCAHSGFEHARDFWELANGGLHNKTIYAKVWCFPWKDVPKTKEERIEWLYERWAMMDKWVAEKKAQEGEPGPTRDSKKLD
jgi:1-acyl-sn-glycerol-3-phosphate acyltransferase